MSTLLRPMTAAEFERWSATQHDGYVRQMVQLGGSDPETARAKAAADRARLLPGGFATLRHRFLVAATGEDGRGPGAHRVGAHRVGAHRVGALWVGVMGGAADDESEASAWVFDIEVEHAHRRRGHGRALMLAAEDVAREMGTGTIGLNVFAGNATAIGLYRSLGYVVTERRRGGQNMTKAL